MAWVKHTWKFWAIAWPIYPISPSPTNMNSEGQEIFLSVPKIDLLKPRAGLNLKSESCFDEAFYLCLRYCAIKVESSRVLRQDGTPSENQWPLKVPSLIPFTSVTAPVFPIISALDLLMPPSTSHIWNICLSKICQAWLDTPTTIHNFEVVPRWVLGIHFIKP